MLKIKLELRFVFVFLRVCNHLVCVSEYDRAGIIAILHMWWHTRLEKKKKRNEKK